MTTEHDHGHELRAAAAAIERGHLSSALAAYRRLCQDQAQQPETRLAAATALLRYGIASDVEEALAAAASEPRLRGQLDFAGPPGAAPDGWRPWYTKSAVRNQGYRLLFGHWAQFGFYRAHDAVCLDSGCVYGGRLTALRLNDGQVVQEEAVDDTALAEKGPG